MIKLLRFMKPYRPILVFVVVLAFLQAMANLYLPTLFANIVDNGIIKGDTGYIWRTGGIMLLITLAGTIAAVVGIFFSSQVATGFGKIIRARLFTHVSQFSLHEFDSVSASSLITRTTNDTTQVQQVMILMLNMMITAPFTLIAGIILALNQDVGLTWILVVVMRVVRAFDRKKYEEHRFDEANLDLTNVAIKVNRMVASLMPIMMLCLNVSSIAILWFGAIRINNGQMQVGALIAFLQYAMLILFALLMISMMFIMLPRAAASADRINEVLAIEPEIKDTDHVKQADKQKGYVEFQNVTFSYPGAEEPALSNISFSAVPGEVTAIIGGTGSGKSTLVSLIPRFYDIDEGTGGHLLADGVDVREMSQEHLRSKIGFVPQKAVLFSGTVAENIRYGKEDATDEEVRHAADVAQATEFISTGNT